MKYFTAQLWADINSPRSKAACKEWDRNVARYREHLKTVLPKMSARARWFFHEISLHDGTLTRMEVGDRIEDTEGKWERCNINRRKAGVRLSVLSADGDYVFRLEYKQVSRVEMSFPGKSLFPSGWDPNFGDWGYDEITEGSDGAFQHEVLFSSGATILIEFAKFTFNKSPAKPAPSGRKQKAR